MVGSDTRPAGAKPIRGDQMSIEAKILAIHDRLAAERKRVTDLCNQGIPSLMQFREDGSPIHRGGIAQTPPKLTSRNQGMARVDQARGG